MWTSIRGAWDFLLHLTGTAPLGFWAVLLGLLGSLATTYAVKNWVVARWALATWSDDGRRAFTQTLAFFAGVAWCWLFWFNRDGLLVGILVGLLAPLFWAIAMWAIGKRWPDLRARIGGQ